MRTTRTLGLPLAAAQAGFEDTGFVIAASDDELDAAISEARTARSLWRSLLMAGFVVLLIESVFAFCTHRKRKANLGGAE